MPPPPSLNLSYAPASTKKEEISQLNKVLNFFGKTETPQKYAETPQKKEETTQLNRVIKNTQIFCGNASKKTKPAQLNRVFKNTETPQKKKGNTSTK